jgi:chromosome partitioning protein
MKIVATYNIKGGVGKTSAAVNIAAIAAGDGLRTLIWDLDPQGAATFLFRVKSKVRGGAEKLVQGKTDVADLLRGTDIEGLDLLPADFSYRNMDLALDDAKRPTRQLTRVLGPLATAYDLVVLDCPPSISLVSENVFHAADALLVPIIPTTLSLRTFDQLLGFVAKLDRPPEIIAFFSMVDRRKRLHREIMAEAPARYPSIVSAAIPSATAVERMGVHRNPLSVFAPRSGAALAYHDLWRQTRSHLKL